MVNHLKKTHKKLVTRVRIRESRTGDREVIQETLALSVILHLFFKENIFIYKILKLLKSILVK